MRLAAILPMLAVALLAGVARAQPAAPASPQPAPQREAPSSPGPAARPDGAGQVTFRVEDRRDAREVAESTTLYVNRRQVGQFRLDALTPSGALDVTVPAAASYEYALCGTITIRTDRGEEVHRVNSAGQLGSVAGHVFEALGASDFTLFYLADRGGGEMPAMVRRGDPRMCTPATS